MYGVGYPARRQAAGQIDLKPEGREGEREQPRRPGAVRYQGAPPEDATANVKQILGIT